MIETPLEVLFEKGPLYRYFLHISDKLSVMFEQYQLGYQETIEGKLFKRGGELFLEGNSKDFLGVSYHDMYGYFVEKYIEDASSDIYHGFFSLGAIKTIMERDPSFIITADICFINDLLSSKQINPADLLSYDNKIHSIFAEIGKQLSDINAFSFEKWPKRKILQVKMFDAPYKYETFDFSGIDEHNIAQSVGKETSIREQKRNRENKFCVSLWNNIVSKEVLETSLFIDNIPNQIKLTIDERTTDSKNYYKKLGKKYITTLVNIGVIKFTDRKSKVRLTKFGKVISLIEQESSYTLLCENRDLKINLEHYFLEQQSFPSFVERTLEQDLNLMSGIVFEYLKIYTANLKILNWKDAHKVASHKTKCIRLNMSV